MFGINPAQLRRDWLARDSEPMRRRRRIVALSLLGAASLSLATLRQTGLIRHLPDPPFGPFNSDAVSTSNAAYALGAPDGPVAATSFLASAALAGLGRADRARTMPWVPVVATAHASVNVAGAAAYLWDMVVRERAGCAYCLFTAATSVGIFALTLPEAAEAVRAATQKAARGVQQQ